MNAGPLASGEYWAFISYSEKDIAEAKALQRYLELSPVPRALVDSPIPGGSAPKRFAPLFLARWDLGASASLDKGIDSALERSRYLIVVCSPHAAKSQWVEREVRAFRDLGGGDRILPLIIDGEPSADGPRAAFPRALHDMNPSAADAQPGRDGLKIAHLKTLAGMLGIETTDLLQRETQRRIRTLQRYLAAALALAVVLGAVIWYALRQRDIAVTSRTHAEEVLQFLVSDVNAALIQSGCPQVVDLINERFDNYYAKLVEADQESLQMLAERANADDVAATSAFSKGRFEEALRKYQVARTIRERLAAREPEVPEWLYYLGVSNTHIGNVLRAQGNTKQALGSYHASLAIINRIRRSDMIRQPLFRRQVAITHFFIAKLQMELRAYAEAKTSFEASRTLAQQLVDEDPDQADMWQQDVDRVTREIEAAPKTARSASNRER